MDKRYRISICDAEGGELANFTGFDKRFLRNEAGRYATQYLEEENKITIEIKTEII